MERQKSHERPASRLRLLVVAGVVVLASLVIGTGVFLLRRDAGKDLGEARAMGKTTGAAQGLQNGQRYGFRIGYRAGLRAGISSAYTPAYRSAYQAQFADAGLEGPTRQEIKVLGP